MGSNKKPSQYQNYYLDEQFKVSALENDSNQSSDRDDYYNNEVIYSLELNNEIEQVFADGDHYHERTRNGRQLVLLDNQCEDNLQIEQQNGQCDHQCKENHVKQLANQESETNNGFIVSESEAQKMQIIVQQTKKRKRRQILNLLEKSSISLSKPKTPFEQIQYFKEQMVFSQAIFQKKKQNHSLLKSWNYRRLQVVQLHRKICEQIVGNVEKYQKLSVENFQVFRAFFGQKCRQLQIKINAKLSFNKQLDGTNFYSRGIYSSGLKALSSIRQRQKIQKEQTINLKNQLETKILKQKFENYFNTTHRQFIKLKSKVSAMKQMLNESDEVICKKLIKFQTHFMECLQNVKEEQLIDFYRTQISYLMKCEEQVMLYHKFGELVVRYYKQAIQDEKKRKQCIEVSLQNYLGWNGKYEENIRLVVGSTKKKKKQKYLQMAKQPQQKLQEIEKQKQQQQENDQSFSKTNDNTIQQLYKLPNIIQPSLIAQFLKKPNSHHSEKQKKKPCIPDNINRFLTMDQLQNFLLKFEVEQFTCQHLTIKKYKIEVLKENRWVPGEIVITIDRFVHVFVQGWKCWNGVIGDRGTHYGKPEFTVKINLLKISLPTCVISEEDQASTDDQLQVILSANKMDSGLQKFSSLLKNTKKMEWTVRFFIEDDLLEFQSYLLELSV